MSVTQDIQSSVFFNEAEISLIISLTWGDMVAAMGGSQDNTVLMEDMIDSITGNAFKIVGDIAYDRAGVL